MFGKDGNVDVNNFIKWQVTFKTDDGKGVSDFKEPYAKLIPNLYKTISDKVEEVIKKARANYKPDTPKPNPTPIPSGYDALAELQYVTHMLLYRSFDFREIGKTFIDDVTYGAGITEGISIGDITFNKTSYKEKGDKTLIVVSDYVVKLNGILVVLSITNNDKQNFSMGNITKFSVNFI